MATVRLDQKSRAIVRSISESYIDALASYFGDGPTDIDVAKAQHRAYSEALSLNGVEVTTLDADQNHPDCVFVEDLSLIHISEPTRPY